MAYIQGGELKSSRSIWRLSIITDFFLAVFFYVKVFWTTMFSSDESSAFRKPKSGRRPGSGGAGGGGGGGWGGGGPGNPGTGSRPKGIRDMSSIRGSDHNAPCSSCCGG